MPHLSAILASEVVNGFDIHPHNGKLLIPVVRDYAIPLIVEYNLTTQTADTLDVDFELSWNRVCLWLRYNRDGTKILYSHFPEYAFSIAPADDSEVGVIDRASLTKTIFDVNTHAGARSISVFPNWSPDERHIVYGSAPVTTLEGVVGTYRLYILKNVPPY